MNIPERSPHFALTITAILIALVIPSAITIAQDVPPSSYAPVVERESFEAVVQRMTSEKSQIAQRHQQLLESRVRPERSIC